MSAAHHTKNIERHRTDSFLVRTFDEWGRGGERVVIHRGQIKAYFDHDRALRFKDDVALDTPVGYHLFRESYSREAKSTARFAFCEVDESGNINIVTPGPPPTEQEVLGDGADLCIREEGMVLNSSQADIVNSLLWDAARQWNEQQQRSHQGYLDRCERRDDRRHRSDPYGDGSSYDRRRSRGSRFSRSSRRLGNPTVTTDPDTREPYAPEHPTAGPSTVADDQHTVGVEGYKEHARRS